MSLRYKDQIITSGKSCNHSNPNLLINWYLADPINQREGTTYDITGTSTPTYTVDRWRGIRHTLEVADGYCRFTSTKSNDYKRFAQLVENGFKAGITYTVSMLAKISDISGTCRLGAVDGDSIISSCPRTQIENITSSYELFTNTFTPSEDMRDGGVELLCYNTASDYIDIDVIAWKLELGDQQTLAHKEGDKWVLNDPPPDKELELLKCCRYFQRIASINGASYSVLAGSSVDTSISLVCPMRTTPAFSSPKFTIRKDGANTTTSATITGIGISANRLLIKIGGSFQGGYIYGYFITSGKLDLDAEL